MPVSHYEEADELRIAADCIIFGFDGTQLNVLLRKRDFEPEKGKWSLIGGFVRKDESVDTAASRILQRTTGLTNLYMEQLHCFGDVNRDPGGRVVSVAYFALINIADYIPQDIPDHEVQWFPLNNIPPVIFDHKSIILNAKERLQQKVSNHPIGFALLPYKFTLPQLQSLYEAIYEYPLDRRNFSRKILSLGILQKLDEKEKFTSRKGAFYYVFDQKKYDKLETEGLKFI